MLLQSVNVNYYYLSLQTNLGNATGMRQGMSLQGLVQGSTCSTRSLQSHKELRLTSGFNN